MTVQVRPAPGPGPEAQPDLTFRLAQSQPNPFHTTTTIVFTSPLRARARMTVFDVGGQKVATLLDDVVDAGQYVVRWSGTDDSGQRLAPGVYMYRLDIGRRHSIKKLVFTH